MIIICKCLPSMHQSPKKKGKATERKRKESISFVYKYLHLFLSVCGVLSSSSQMVYFHVSELDAWRLMRSYRLLGFFFSFFQITLPRLDQWQTRRDRPSVSLVQGVHRRRSRKSLRKWSDAIKSTADTSNGYSKRQISLTMKSTRNVSSHQVRWVPRRWARQGFFSQSNWHKWKCRPRIVSTLKPYRQGRWRWLFVRKLTMENHVLSMNCWMNRCFPKCPQSTMTMLSEWFESR